MRQHTDGKCKIFTFLKTKDWVTTAEVCESCSVSSSTANRYFKELEKMGLLDTAISYPTRYYRLSREAKTEEALNHIKTLEALEGILSLASN